MNMAHVVVSSNGCWSLDLLTFCCILTNYLLCVAPTGTRNAILNTEARTVEAEVLSRRCVIMRLVDFSYEEYQKALRQSAGAVVIILPKNMSAVPQDIVQVIMFNNGLVSRYDPHSCHIYSTQCQCFASQCTWCVIVKTVYSVQQFMELEPEMLATETIVPIYFAMEDDELLSIYTQTLTSSSSQGSLSAAEGRDFSSVDWTVSVELKYFQLRCLLSLVLLHTATANGFQMVTSGAQSKAISDWAITSLEVRDRS